MNAASALKRTRSAILHYSFGLLYSRLGFLHETAGRAVYGPSWAGRRSHVVPSNPDGLLLDVGCGEGRLLAMLANRNIEAVGVDPSAIMSRKAKGRDVVMVQASAQALPFLAGTFQHIVSTYPGPWILDPETWNEFARVTTPGATLRVLIGGDVSRGRGSRIRRLLLRTVYGNAELSIDGLPPIEHPQLVGSYSVIEDEWGSAVVWSGVRSE